MKRHICNSGIGLLLITLFAGCSTTPLTIDSRYTFDEFEQVDHIVKATIDGWEPVDSQSLIVHTGPSNAYLLVLSYPMRDINFAESITLTGTGNWVEAKFDCIQTEGPGCSGGNISAPIHRIYRLEDRESVSYVKDKIREDTD